MTGQAGSPGLGPPRPDGAAVNGAALADRERMKDMRQSGAMTGRSASPDAADLGPDAARLLSALADRHGAVFPERVMPGQIALGLGLDQKRAGLAFRELAEKGYYEWDISAYAGWLTPRGLAAAKAGEGDTP